MVYNDRFVYKKLTLGEPLTEEDMKLVLDANSIENIVKMKYENILTNEELQEYAIKKRELQMDCIICILESIYEYMIWQETIQAQYTKAQLFEDLDKEPIMKDSYTKDGWMQDFLKNMLPKGTHEDVYKLIESNIKALSNDPTQKIDMRAITAVMELANHSPILQAFLFPERHPNHDHHEHALLIANRICYVGAALRHMHSHQIMNNIKNHLAQLPDEKHERSHSPINLKNK